MVWKFYEKTNPLTKIDCSLIRLGNRILSWRNLFKEQGDEINSIEYELDMLTVLILMTPPYASISKDI